MKKTFTHFLTGVAGACLLAGGALSAQGANKTAYGYSLGERDASKFGFVSFDIDAPQTLNYLKINWYGPHPSAGEYVDGKIYTYLIDNDDFNNVYAAGWAVYDGETYEKVASAPLPDANRVLDMTFDYTTNTMYALMEDEYNTGLVTASSLCAIDLATGEYTIIGSPGELTAIDGYGNPDADGLITLACDAAGQLWAMSQYRYFYKVDKFTGAVTQVGSRHNLGTRNDFQSMTFDTDGHLWWAQNHPSYGHFCEIDLETAIPGGFQDFKTDYDKLSKLGNDAQVTALFFKDKEVNRKALKAVTGLKAGVNPPEVHSVALSWTLPAEDYSGNAAAPTGVRVYRLGTSEPIATLAADATSYTDSEAPDGTICYQIVPFNEDGTGYPAFVEVFAGYDKLGEPTDIAVSLSGRTATVTWTAPAYTLNGGYADYGNITYNIYRMRGDTEQLVAQAVADTEYSETIDADGAYTYEIEPVNGGVKGMRGKSESFSLSSTAALPYFTGFEDDEEGSPWTIKNTSPTNYGWYLGAKSYIYAGKKTAIASVGSATTAGENWLISPAFHLEPGVYVVDYYANGASYDTHSYDVKLGTDAEDTESFLTSIYTLEDAKAYDKDNNGWQHVEEEFTIPASGTYHVGICHRTKTAYSNLRIDNLSVKAKSSAIDGVGADASFTVSVSGGIITVSGAAEVARVDLIDMNGRTVSTTTETTLDASGMHGVYIVGVTSASGTRTYTKLAL
ncbi:MAG: fibronectin type III domain-containing protein [Muribaculaceae bacterium]|nr:fibronectin type III domain-containing protein [Muribaculaceae bacterium]